MRVEHVHLIVPMRDDMRPLYSGCATLQEEKKHRNTEQGQNTSNAHALVRDSGSRHQLHEQAKCNSASDIYKQFCKLQQCCSSTQGYAVRFGACAGVCSVHPLNCPDQTGCDAVQSVTDAIPVHLDQHLSSQQGGWKGGEKYGQHKHNRDELVFSNAGRHSGQTHLCTDSIADTECHIRPQGSECFNRRHNLSQVCESVKYDSVVFLEGVNYARYNVPAMPMVRVGLRFLTTARAEKDDEEPNYSADVVDTTPPILIAAPEKGNTSTTSSDSIASSTATMFQTTRRRRSTLELNAWEQCGTMFGIYNYELAWCLKQLGHSATKAYKRFEMELMELDGLFDASDCDHVPPVHGRVVKQHMRLAIPTCPIKKRFYNSSRMYSYGRQCIGATAAIVLLFSAIADVDIRKTRLSVVSFASMLIDTIESAIDGLCNSFGVQELRTARVEVRALRRSVLAVRNPQFTQLCDKLSAEYALRAELSAVSHAAWPHPDELCIKGRPSETEFDRAATDFAVQAGISYASEPTAIPLAKLGQMHQPWLTRMPTPSGETSTVSDIPSRQASMSSCSYDSSLSARSAQSETDVLHAMLHKNTIFSMKRHRD